MVSKATQKVLYMAKLKTIRHCSPNLKKNFEALI
jgi:hypothetical protein